MRRKYIVLTAKGEAKCQEEEFAYPRELAANEAIIKTSYSLIGAGTELSRVYAIKQGFTYPVYPGYAAIGRIMAKGEGLKDLAINDRVFYSGPHASINRFNHQAKTQGNKIMKIDEQLDDKEAALIPLGLIAMNVITACDGKLNDTAVVYGLGTIGILAALLLKEAGFHTLAFDPVPARCEEAKALGLKEVFDCAASEQAKVLNELTQGKGADISVDASGLSAVIAQAILQTAKHGQVILLGSPRAAYNCDITPLLNTIHMRMLNVKGAFNELNPFPPTDGLRRNVLRDFATVEKLLRNKVFNADKLISQVIKPEGIMTAYHGLMYDKEKWRCVLIDWRE